MKLPRLRGRGAHGILHDARTNWRVLLPFIGLTVATTVAVYIAVMNSADIREIQSKPKIVQRGLQCSESNPEGCERLVGLLTEVCERRSAVCEDIVRQLSHAGKQALLRSLERVERRERSERRARRRARARGDARGGVEAPVPRRRSTGGRPPRRGGSSPPSPPPAPPRPSPPSRTPSQVVDEILRNPERVVGDPGRIVDDIGCALGRPCR